jgi:hypothetical protein
MLLENNFISHLVEATTLNIFTVKKRCTRMIKPDMKLPCRLYLEKLGHPVSEKLCLKRRV